MATDFVNGTNGNRLEFPSLGQVQNTDKTQTGSTRIAYGYHFLFESAIRVDPVRILHLTLYEMNEMNDNKLLT